MTRVINSPPRMMQGATSTVDGVSGYVPTPTAGNETEQYLRKDGAWATPAGTGGPGDGAGVSYSAATNNSGNTTITPSEVFHRAQVTFGGSGSTTRIIVLATDLITAGASIKLRALLPATADIRVEFRNGSAAGTLLHSLLTDGSGDDASLEFYSNGSAWNFDNMVYPANAST